MYHQLFDFEKQYTSSQLQSWLLERTKWPIFGTLSFLIMIAFLPGIMRSRKPLQLKYTLFWWNIGLALFSTFASIRMIEFTWNEYTSSKSLTKAICELGTDNISSFWMYCYVMSKFVQFGDTFFLIVRKKRLTFLHLWHHSIVLPFMWTQFATGAPALKYFMLMNVIIHAAMYFYYAIQAIGIRVHQSVAMIITSVQIIQMIIGLWTQYLTYHFLAQGKSCFRNDFAAAFAFLVYGSCFYLFSAFFVEKYLTKSNNDVNQNQIKKK